MQNINSVPDFITAIEADVQLETILPSGGVKIEGMAPHARPQHEYVNLGDEPVAVSHVFRFETIGQE
ncbi:hypothetical protein [Nitratireductor luteus]|uniref:hypothetical protein n=1 Tax=Nitratireductor luteus TaxID=2976980 RepID=UPI0022406AC5|nr:hypothetical protein [Nitratireductor luteus]